MNWLAIYRTDFKEGPEGVKLELGFGQIFTGKVGKWVAGTGIWSLGMGITDRKTIELGL